jgi:hypothetical protein
MTHRVNSMSSSVIKKNDKRRNVQEIGLDHRPQKMTSIIGSSVAVI